MHMYFLVSDVFCPMESPVFMMLICPLAAEREKLLVDEIYHLGNELAAARKFAEVDHVVFSSMFV